MRQNKFRGWDKVKKIMVYDFNDYFICMQDGELEVANYDEGYTIELMEYIGVPDKTGKQVFEGDIMQCIDDSGEKTIFVCEYGIARRIMQSGIEVDIPSFYFLKSDGRKSFPIVKNYIGKHDLQIIEIVGNIYENPEMLKTAE